MQGGAGRCREVQGGTGRGREARGHSTCTTSYTDAPPTIPTHHQLHRRTTSYTDAPPTTAAAAQIPLGVPNAAGFEGIRAVAVLPALDPALNVRTMQTRMFQQIGEKAGATVAFDGGGTGRRRYALVIRPAMLCARQPVLVG